MSSIGFPALAGMDPVEAIYRLRDERIPRARGDGPGDHSLGVPFPLDSPRSRGWTLPRADGGERRDGFPALAGMDPPARPGRGA